MINVDIIADSVSPKGDRVTTFILEYPRFIHSELMTHRVFSRNCASSRAIPIQTQIELAKQNLVIPVWTAKKKGMQGEVIYDDNLLKEADIVWMGAFKAAINAAEKLDNLGIHKQNANRLLEPFVHMKTILTGTDFTNFFNLRCHKDAQPEMQALAYAMRDCYQESKPKELNYGEWHLPFVDPESKDTLDIKKLISVSCCAQVSYRKNDISIEKAISIVDRLVTSDRLHASPFEHVCRPLTEEDTPRGNLKGWHQYRTDVEEGVA